MNFDIAFGFADSHLEISGVRLPALVAGDDDSPGLRFPRSTNLACAGGCGDLDDNLGVFWTTSLSQ